MIWKTQIVSVNVVAFKLHDPEVLFTIKDASKGYTGLDTPINMFQKTHDNFSHNNQKAKNSINAHQRSMDKKELLGSNGMDEFLPLVNCD